MRFQSNEALLRAALYTLEPAPVAAAGPWAAEKILVSAYAVALTEPAAVLRRGGAVLVWDPAGRPGPVPAEFAPVFASPRRLRVFRRRR